MHSVQPNNVSDLVNRLKSGEVAAYEEIYFAYSKVLLSGAYKKTGDRVLAEELVQNIFITLWEKKATLEIRDLKNYLFGALKFSVINHLRSEAIANKYVAYQQLSVAENADDSSVQLELKDLTGIIEEGLNTLPQKTQEVFRLSRYEHHSTKDISSELNISEKAVEYHITQSLKRIRQYVKNFYTFFLL